MLFRCLHPMELDTGPWTRKSSILCSLLLLATFSVLQVTGQDETVGLGKHTLLKDGKVNLNTEEYDNYIGLRKNISYTEYKKLAGACNVTIKNGFIELKYEGKLCTVDLLSDFNDKIKFKAGVRNGKGLSSCLGTNREESHWNLLPFIYSKDNKEIKRFSKDGPTLKGTCDKNKCKEEKGGECLNETSLEISWHKEEEVHYIAYVHLIQELDKGLEVKNDGNKKEKIFDLEIRAEDNFTMINSSKKNTYNPSNEAVCALENNPIIVKPVAWTINNTLLKDEYLLIFSLLSLNATKVFTGNVLKNDPPSGPKCELFIQFDTTYYRLLTAIPTPTPTCTTPSTTTTTTTTEAPSGIAISCPTLKSEPVTTTTKSSTTKIEEESNTGLYVVFGIIVMFLLCVVGILAFFLVQKTNKLKEMQKPEQAVDKDKSLRALYDSEVKKKGPAAVGTFDKWKEDRKKNEKGAAEGEQPSMTKSALGNDKSAVDKGKSSKTDAEKPTVIEIPQNAEESKAEGAALEEAKPDENGEVKSKAENEA